MMNLITAVLFVLITASAASAEWRVYENRDGRRWAKTAEVWPTKHACEAAAKRIWDNRNAPKLHDSVSKVQGVACNEEAVLSPSVGAPRRGPDECYDKMPLEFWRGLGDEGFRRLTAVCRRAERGQ